MAGASGICAMVLICMYCACTCICIYLCVSMYIYMYIYVFVYHVRGMNCGKLRKKKKFCLHLVWRLRFHAFGEGEYCFTSVRFLLPVFRLSWFLCTLNIYAHISSHFSQQLLMAEICYFGHKLHIGTPYRGKRFWTRQIPTSCLPT